MIAFFGWKSKSKGRSELSEFDIWLSMYPFLFILILNGKRRTIRISPIGNQSTVCLLSRWFNAVNPLYASLVLLLFSLSVAVEQEPMIEEASDWIVREVSSGNPASLQDMYRQGENALVANRPFEAEVWFKTILKADSNDWDARERLVGIYQALGLKEERDNQLSALRRMYHTGLAWKPYICREQFLYGKKIIKALEIPGMESDGRRVLIFMVSDQRSGRFLYAATVKRKEKSETAPSLSSRIDVRTYELLVIKNSRRKAVEIVNRKPGYSDMKRFLLKTLIKE